MSHEKTSTNLPVESKASKLESVLIQGDLERLSPEERANYFMSVCNSLGLNHLTRPFEYLKLNGRLTLYAKRDATDQLRKVHNVSVKITGRELQGDIYVVTAQANIGERTDESIGAVHLGKTYGDARANLVMKAETKAKRRVTLSICGLGLLDETEVESIPEAREEKKAETKVPTGNTVNYDKRHDERMAQPATEAQIGAIKKIKERLGEEWGDEDFVDMTKQEASDIISASQRVGEKSGKKQESGVTTHG